MDQNKRFNKTATVLRILLALTFFAGGWSYFFTPVDKIPMDLGTADGRFMAALFTTGYFLPFLKIVEGIAGTMLFFKRWTPLALIILAPITINIFLFGLFLAPQGSYIFGMVLGIIQIFLAWKNFDKYRALFQK